MPGAAVDPAAPAPPVCASFPIVGIGASAGGLEALEQLLGHVPAGSGMAFVIVQHLDPTRKGIMPELLQRNTIMKVAQVKDRTKVRPDCVYVIPPNKDMSILHGVLHLLEPAAPRGLRLPIDFFLRSLALDQEERSIGVILSGMGSDGTLGLRAIKEKAGVVLVQDPATAKFDGMPRSAVDAGLADIVAPVDELPGKLLAYLQRTPFVARTEEAMDDKTQSALEKAVILLRAHTGQDFSLYKRSTLYRRIERRMGIHQLPRMAAYVRYLQENSQELGAALQGVVDRGDQLLPRSSGVGTVAHRGHPSAPGAAVPGQALRAWVPGCSTGEEAYSLAIVRSRRPSRPDRRGTSRCKSSPPIWIGTPSTRPARGCFRQHRRRRLTGAAGAVSSAKEEHGYRVRKEIREMVIFAPQNLIMDPPFTKLDILCCRNLLIYLTPEVQKKLTPLFHYSLNPGASCYSAARRRSAGPPICLRRSAPNRDSSNAPPPRGRTEPVEFPSSFSAARASMMEVRQPTKLPLSLQSVADQLVLQRYAPPAVLVMTRGTSVYVSGHTGKYLEPAAGKANWNLFAMAREGLRYELAAAFQKGHPAKRQGGAPRRPSRDQRRRAAAWT
jgi:chemotaxis methyl-accepting protein methylase